MHEKRNQGILEVVCGSMFSGKSEELIRRLKRSEIAKLNVVALKHGLDSGKKVIVGGLDLDFRGIPFGPMPILMAIADKVTKLKAICIECGNDAHFSQRLVDGKPAKYSDPIILIGAQECYQARCRACFEIVKKLEL